MQITSGQAAVNGAELHYQLAGKGPLVVLLHAGIADLRMWDAQLAVLGRYFSVLRYDRRGYGKSPLPEGNFSHREDLHALLMHLGVNVPVHLAGASYGGWIALDFAYDYPDQVASLTLIGSSPSGFSFNGTPPPQWEALDEAVEAGDLELAAELEVQIWVDGETRTPDQVPAAIRDLVREMNLIALRNETLGIGEDRPYENTFDLAAKLTQPTLIMWGDLDRPRVQAVGEALTVRMPNARKHIIHGTAHLPNLEQPEEVNRVLLGFLQEVTRS